MEATLLQIPALSAPEAGGGLESTGAGLSGLCHPSAEGSDGESEASEEPDQWHLVDNHGGSQRAAAVSAAPLPVVVRRVFALVAPGSCAFVKLEAASGFAEAVVSTLEAAALAAAAAATAQTGPTGEGALSWTAETGIDRALVKEGLENDDHEVLLSVLRLVRRSGLLDAPTVREANATLERAWASDGDDGGPRIRTVEVLKNDAALRTEALRRARPRFPQHAPRMALALQVLAPWALERPWVQRLLLPTPSRSWGSSRQSPNPEQLGLGVVRCVSWHPQHDRVAVAFASDAARVYDVGAQAWDDFVGSLTHERQMDVSCVEWQPMSSSALALACAGGVCFWTRGLSCVSFLATPSKVTSLAWAPDGRLLASASACSGDVTVWDMGARSPTTLRRLRGRTAALSWSPSGLYLLAQTDGVGLRVWETKTWGSEVWSDLRFPAQATAWSGDGRTLLVASGSGGSAGAGVANVHAIALAKLPPALDGALLPLSLDLASSIAPAAALGFGTPAASAVRCMAWNSTSERLAIAFEDAPGVALYAATHFPALSLFFLGYVWGPPGTLPKALHFRRTTAGHGSLGGLGGLGALLLVVFEDAHEEPSARTHLQFVPMHFSSLRN